MFVFARAVQDQQGTDTDYKTRNSQQDQTAVLQEHKDRNSAVRAKYSGQKVKH